MDLLFDACWRDIERGVEREYVTGNNDADGVYLLLWARRASRSWRSHLRAKLAQWGGNASGVNIANIDNLGNVHPDTYWWHYSLGNVTRTAVLADLARHLRSADGRPEGKAAPRQRPLRRLPLPSTSAAATPACVRCSSPATRGKRIRRATLSDEEIGVTAARRASRFPLRKRASAAFVTMDAA